MQANTILNSWIAKTANSMNNQIYGVANFSVYGTANNQSKNMETYVQDTNKYIVCDDFICQSENGNNNEICK